MRSLRRKEAFTNLVVRVLRAGKARLLPGVTAARQRLGAERLWLFRWAAIGFAINKMLVYSAAAVGAWERYFAHPESGFLYWLFVRSFNQFDSWWFQRIAQNGYYSPEASAFYPGYPLLIRGVAELLHIPLSAAGVLVTTVCFFFALYFFLKLLLLDLDRSRAVRCMLLLVLFPTAFYFSATYSEALFLMLSVLVLYALRTQRWTRGSVWGGLAALTRNTGLALGLPFLVEYLQNWWRKPRPRPRPWPMLWVGVIALGTLTYFLYCWGKFGSPLVFLSAEKQHWGRYFSPPWLTLYEGFKFNLQWLEHLRFSLYQNWTAVYYSTEMLFPAGAIIVLLASIRRMRWSYWLILFYSIVVPLTVPVHHEVQDYFVGFSRYMLTVVPLFLGLERVLRNRWAYLGYLFFSLLLMLVFTYAFSQHKVVA